MRILFEMSRKTGFRVASMFYYGGFLVLAVGLVLLGFEIRFQVSAERTTATIVKVETNRTSDGVTYQPTFTFTHNGQDITTGTRSSSSSWNYQPGQQIEVSYLPSDPHRAKPTDFFSTWAAPGILIIIGIGWTAIGGACRHAFKKAGSGDCSACGNHYLGRPKFCEDCGAAITSA